MFRPVGNGEGYGYGYGACYGCHSGAGFGYGSGYRYTDYFDTGDSYCFTQEKIHYFEGYIRQFELSDDGLSISPVILSGHKGNYNTVRAISSIRESR